MPQEFLACPWGCQHQQVIQLHIPWFFCEEIKHFVNLSTFCLKSAHVAAVLYCAPNPGIQRVLRNNWQRWQPWANDLIRIGISTRMFHRWEGSVSLVVWGYQETSSVCSSARWHARLWCWRFVPFVAFGNSAWRNIQKNRRVGRATGKTFKPLNLLFNREFMGIHWIHQCGLAPHELIWYTVFEAAQGGTSEIGFCEKLATFLSINQDSLFSSEFSHLVIYWTKCLSLSQDEEYSRCSGIARRNLESAFNGMLRRLGEWEAEGNWWFLNFFPPGRWVNRMGSVER